MQTKFNVGDKVKLDPSLVEKLIKGAEVVQIQIQRMFTQMGNTEETPVYFLKIEGHPNALAFRERELIGNGEGGDLEL